VLVEIGFVVLGQQAVGAKSSVALVKCRLRQRFYKRLLQARLGTLTGEMPHRGTILSVQVKDCDTADFLRLWHLNAHESAVVVALGQQLRSLHQLAVVAKAVRGFERRLIWLAGKFRPEKLRSSLPMWLVT
jgi:hypothetical protein